MRVHVLTVGRLRSGPEKALVDDYLSRFDKTGRALGLTLGGIAEVEDKKSGGPGAEAQLLRKAMPEGADLWVLDERGRQMTSPDFAIRARQYPRHGPPRSCADDRRGGRPRSFAEVGSQPRDRVRIHGVAAYAGSRDAQRTALPRGDDPLGRKPLPPGVAGKRDDHGDLQNLVPVFLQEQPDRQRQRHQRPDQHQREQRHRPRCSPAYRARRGTGPSRGSTA
jgi:hypothetical protein